MKYLISVEKDEVTSHLRKLHIHKNMRLNGKYLRELMKLVNVIACLSISFERPKRFLITAGKSHACLQEMKEDPES